jgi:hypothetical protein
MRKVLLFLLPVFLSNSCQHVGDHPSTNNRNTPRTDSVTVSTPKYWHLTGLIGKYPVVMDLAYRPTIEEGYTYLGYHGSYYYKNKAHPIDLYGSVDSTGSLVLSEVHYLDAPSPSFSGAFNPELGSFSGTWSDGTGKRNLAFNLEIDHSDESLAFEVQKLEARKKLFPKKNNSPTAGYSMVWISPSNAKNDLKTFLDREILRGLTGYEERAAYQTPQKAFAAISTEFFRAYMEDLEDVTLEEVGDAVSFNQEQNLAVEVLFNQHALLTLGYWNYWYGGGAHGNYATLLRTYDLKSSKVVTLEDIFRDGYRTKLVPFLENAVRAQFGLNPEDALSQVLFSDEVQLTENFGLTEKGIIFDYPPYEIAAYAWGEIRLFIPFSDIKSLLQPDLKARYAVE